MKLFLLTTVLFTYLIAYNQGYNNGAENQKCLDKDGFNDQLKCWKERDAR